MAIKVSIVEDDSEIREGLESLLCHQPDIEFLNSYSTAEAALKGIPLEKPDIILMDINLPNMSGVDCVRELTSRHSDLVVLMLTVYEDTDVIFKSLSAGASGYLLKRTSSRELVHSIRQAREGSSPMSGHIARKVVQYFHRPSSPAPGVDELSPREKEILAHLAGGLMYKEIADKMGISFDTVRKHLTNVYRKLHVRSRTEAVLKFLGK